MDTWRRFRLLTGIERRVVLETLVGLPAIRVAMRVAGFPICKAALVRWRVADTRDAASAADRAEAQRIARLEAATAKHLFFRPTCLEQSLLLCWMLRRRGMNPELRVGARKEAERFEAHAWVELDGTALDGGDEEHLHFVPFKNLETSLETQTR